MLICNLLSLGRSGAVPRPGSFKSTLGALSQLCPFYGMTSTADRKLRCVHVAGSSSLDPGTPGYLLQCL